MKRFLIVIALLVVMLGVMLYFAPKPFQNVVSQLAPEGTVFVYCRETSLAATDMGNGYLVECQVETIAETLDSCACVDGISVRICGDAQTFSKLQQQLGLVVCSVQQLDNLHVVCGRSNKVLGGVLLDGKIVNIQMAFDGETITLGYPLILDSF